MSHLKISNHEIELFIRGMKVYKDKLWEDHPYNYSYNHEISKEKRYVDQTIGKMENELKVRAMRPHRVTA
tara:strand:- start:96 stop:305 length:210 start_codon:yes stop_codon:yes gene_type:complete